MRIHVVSYEDALWSEMADLKGSFNFFATLGEGYGEIDGNLQDEIEGLLVPIVGPWEQSDVWFHNQDFYGDGVRCLRFSAGHFPWQTVDSLQKLLVGQCSRFCIVVHISDSLDVDGQWVGTMAITESQVIVTPYVAEFFRQHIDTNI